MNAQKNQVFNDRLTVDCCSLCNHAAFGVWPRAIDAALYATAIVWPFGLAWPIPAPRMCAVIVPRLPGLERAAGAQRGTNCAIVKIIQLATDWHTLGQGCHPH